MVREDTPLSFDDYFWHEVDLNGKVVLDAGTGFGITTSEVARRVYQQKNKGKVISVDVDPAALERARELLQALGLLDLVTFVKADLSFMPEVASESVDVVVSTRTLADINSTPCRLTRAIAEFYRVLRPNGQIVLSDEYPLLAPRSDEESVAVIRWQLVKAISHLIGRAHANEVEPEDLEFLMELVGFRECRWATFKGEAMQRRRIDHFVKSATEMVNKIASQKLKDAFLEEINAVSKMFDERGGTLPPRYVIHARK